MNRYIVKSRSAWAIIDVDTQEEIMEVTSEGYATFLCILLNNGAPVGRVLSRPAPDDEYFKLIKSMVEFNPFESDTDNVPGMAYPQIIRSGDGMRNIITVGRDSEQRGE